MSSSTGNDTPHRPEHLATDTGPTNPGPTNPGPTDTGPTHTRATGATGHDPDDREVPDARFDRDRQSVVAREKEAFGGVKVGSAFFGWLTATGTAVLLTALLAAAGAAVGLATDVDQADAADATRAGDTAGLVGAIVLLVVLFVAYYCGGYVAGRMARFDGIKQGVAVWVWAVVIAVVVAVLGVVAGDRFDVLAQVGSLPQIPLGEGDLTTGAVIAALAVAVASLAGAVLGGLAGMHFHRKVDKAGLGH